MKKYCLLQPIRSNTMRKRNFYSMNTAWDVFLLMIKRGRSDYLYVLPAFNCFKWCQRIVFIQHDMNLTHAWCEENTTDPYLYACVNHGSFPHHHHNTIGIVNIHIITFIAKLTFEGMTANMNPEYLNSYQCLLLLAFLVKSCSLIINKH